eukprot:363362-Chlamydomonas_euryale.AAC.17
MDTGEMQTAALTCTRVVVLPDRWHGARRALLQSRKGLGSSTTVLAANALPAVHGQQKHHFFCFPKSSLPPPRPIHRRPPHLPQHDPASQLRPPAFSLLPSPCATGVCAAGDGGTRQHAPRRRARREGVDSGVWADGRGHPPALGHHHGVFVISLRRLMLQATNHTHRAPSSIPQQCGLCVTCNFLPAGAFLKAPGSTNPLLKTPGTPGSTNPVPQAPSSTNPVPQSARQYKSCSSKQQAVQILFLKAPGSTNALPHARALSQLDDLRTASSGSVCGSVA